ncbi:type II asparaginase [Paenibacillus beijingensis]|uniref:asparaginase n=1 Tax=Paenibacillus beijingensis TaxID=1126833 RepID=A0A0D5NJI0_9BACL|nr:type II asparaginase [Paenibacillus beijingensis]AJY75093.1 L-asparaginase [Paenibacillus beijingensis]
MVLKRKISVALLSTSLSAALLFAPAAVLPYSVAHAETAAPTQEVVKKLPNIKILATGGTIASSAASNTEVTNYQVTQGIDLLLNAVPEMKQIANVSGEQIANVGSSNINNEILLKVAKRINTLLASDDVDGIVVTHGTDTLEETAYFLNLVVKSEKPVVIVGAMRPSSAMSADGPFNLYNAVQLAGTPEAKGKGVLIQLNDRIGAARYITKTNTTATDTFKSPEQGYLGTIAGNRVYFYNEPARKHTTQTVFNIDNLDSLPQVDILYEYQNNGRIFYDAAVQAGAKGIVVAGSGNGTLSALSKAGAADAAQIPTNMDKNQYKYLRKLVEAGGGAGSWAKKQLEKVTFKQGVVIVRSTRTGSGTVTPNPGENDKGFVSSDSLNPQKARILLMLALTKTNDAKEIQSFFNEY